MGTAQKMKFSIKDFFSKCDQIRRKLRIWSHLMMKSLMENFIFCAKGCVKCWQSLREEYSLRIHSYFQWLQMISSIPENWQLIKHGSWDANNLLIHNHHLIRGSSILTTEILAFREIDEFIIFQIVNKPSSNLYFEELLKGHNLDWNLQPAMYNFIQNIHLPLWNYK